MELTRELHQTLLTELQHLRKFDTIFSFSIVFFNLIAWMVGSGLMSDRSDLTLYKVQFVALIIGVVILNSIAIRVLKLGSKTHARLNNGLKKLFEDHDLLKYYDPESENAHQLRYNLFTSVMLLTGVISIVLPAMRWLF